jgi:hypothetical protein
VSDTLAGLDMPVLVPDDVRAPWVTGTGRSRVGGGAAPEVWETVEVAPRPGDRDPSWRLTTLARRGCRPGGDGGWTADPGLADVAERAVGALLLSGVAPGGPREELHRFVDVVADRARQVAAALWDVAVWKPGVLDVGGHRLMLWVHEREEGFAAVADLGPVLVSASGRAAPTWRASLLDPAAAQRRLRR